MMKAGDKVEIWKGAIENGKKKERLACVIER